MHRTTETAVEARLEPHLAEKWRRLADVPEERGSALVACSGGADSVFPAHDDVRADGPGFGHSALDLSCREGRRPPGPDPAGAES